MNKIIPLSLVALVSLSASDVQLAPISIESTTITQVSQNAKLSADIAQALSSSVPSIDMSRRSGIANDIYIRGQKRDNISIEVDGTKICGACPNRMDPPVSHILANQIDEIEVIEGPYDVETFGVMSAGLKITTKKPTKDLSGELNFAGGSWDYRKLGATISGGNDMVRVLVSASQETGGQYRDGDGKTLSQQTQKKAPIPNQYQLPHEDMSAYTKKSLMAKVFVTTTENQELRLGYTANRSDDILYANTPMDAVFDNSNIYSVEYNIKDISDVFANTNIQYYYSDVDHPMSTEYRNAGKMGYMTNQLQTSMEGLKLKNDFELGSYKLLVGLDGSKRTWQGEKFMTNSSTGAISGVAESLTHTLTTNTAIFSKLKKTFGDFDFELGGRYDMSAVKPQAQMFDTKHYYGLNANLLTTYNLNSDNKIFLGIGQASRIPDARELYMGTTKNTDLAQTTNKEVDLGYELHNDMMKFKIKTFYSKLSDYIYLKKGATFQNIDATVYGGEISTSIYATDALTLDMSAAYKRGEKDKALIGQTDKNLADMAPLRANIAASYEYMSDSAVTLETQLSDKWSKYDKDNGEQELAAWGIINAKVKHAFNKHFDFTLGVNNIFDATYAQSNTYVDLTLVSAGVETMLLNDPGRYIYTNLDFKF